MQAEIELPTQAAEVRLPLVLGTLERVNITLVGVGGTGSHLAGPLGQLAWALRQGGTEVALAFIDPDTIEPQNLGRQAFSPAEIGWPKAESLARRISGAYGLAASYMVAPFEAGMVEISYSRDCLNLLIGAVDNAAARQEIARAVERHRGWLWWMDCGNQRASGQVLLGNLTRKDDLKSAFPAGLGYSRALPAPSLQQPDLLKARPQKREEPPASCAQLMARGEQSLTVNSQVASLAFVMLYRLLVSRRLDFFAAYFNSQTFNTGVVGITPANVERAVGLEAGSLQVVRETE